MPGPKFRFVHAADLHLDTPFGAIGRVSPEIARRLRDASIEAFDGLVPVQWPTRQDNSQPQQRFFAAGGFFAWRFQHP